MNALDTSTAKRDVLIHKSDILFDIYSRVSNQPDNDFVQRFAPYCSDRFWSAVESYVEGYTDNYSYDGIKKLYTLWHNFISTYGVVIDDDDFDIYPLWDFDDIIDNFESIGGDPAWLPDRTPAQPKPQPYRSQMRLGWGTPVGGSPKMNIIHIQHIKLNKLYYDEAQKIVSLFITKGIVKSWIF